MLFWLAVFFSFLIQEPTAMGALLLAGHHEGKSILIFFLLWLVATVLDVVVGFLIGRWVKRRFPESKIVKWTEILAKRIRSYAGNTGRMWIVLVLGFFNFPWLNGFIAPWLDMDFGPSIILIALGDFAWYLIEWFAVLGLATAVPNFELALGIVIALGIVGTLVWHHIRNKTGIMR